MSQVDVDERRLCPDDCCVGTLGPDLRCRVCGASLDDRDDEPEQPLLLIKPEGFHRMLKECRVKLGRRDHRKFSLRERWHHRIPKPNWVRQGDDLQLFFERYRDALKGGYVVWAHIVQANFRLFDPHNQDNCPAEVVFPQSPALEVMPSELSLVAQELFAFKGMEPSDPEYAALAEQLTNEMSRSFGALVPSSLSPFPCLRSTVFIARHHLPEGHLACSFFPVVVDPDDSGIVMVVPYRYWSETLVILWREIAALKSA